MSEGASPRQAAAPGVAASLEELIALAGRTPALSRRPLPKLGLAPGSHRSARFSRGMEFAEVRPYQAGDDVRTMDWRQTARRGKPYTKLYHEEHERPVCLLADLGPTMRFATRGAFKSVQAARAAAWLGWSAVAAGDRVGGLVWDGRGHREIRPRGRHHGVLDLVRALAEASASEPGPDRDLGTSLEALGRTLRPGTRTVLLSDFAALDPAMEKRIAALAGRGELVLVHVFDIFEAEAPPPGCYRLTDGQRLFNLDLRSSEARSAYEAAFSVRRDALAGLARRTGATLVPLPTDGDPAVALPW